MDDELTAGRETNLDGLWDQVLPVPPADRAGIRKSVSAAQIMGACIQFGRAFWRHRTILLCVLALAMGALLAVSLKDAQSAREQAAASKILAQRAQAMQAFTAQMFSPRNLEIISAHQPAQPMSVTELLDLHTPRIKEQFAGDMQAQVQLLDIAAEVHRALGNMSRYQALRLQQGQLLMATEDGAGPEQILRLIRDAQAAIPGGAPGTGQDFLDQADQMITQTGLTESAVKARWWAALASTLRGPDASNVRYLDALRKSAQLYASVAPTDPDYFRVATQLAEALSDQDRKQALAWYERALQLAASAGSAGDRTRAERLYPGLAQLQENLGDYPGALESLRSGVQLLPRAESAKASRDIAQLARYGGWLHRYGERAVAIDLLGGPGSWGQPSQGSTAESDAASLLMHAQRLLAEGQIEAALSQAKALALSGASEMDERHKIELGLVMAEAYRHQGQHSAAHSELAPLTESVLARENAEEPTELQQRVRYQWGAFLLGGRQPSLAETHFEQILLQANGRDHEVSVLARLGLAELAERRQRWPEMLRQTTLAVVSWENLRGPRDVRTGPRVWVMHARALRRSGDPLVARFWAGRALEASRQYDAPEADSHRMAEHEIDELAKAEPAI